MDDHSIQWPPPEALDDVDLLALNDPRNWTVVDEEGNSWEAHPIYPAFEMGFGPDGTTARHVYEDRVVELVWDAEDECWKEPGR